MKTHSNKSVHKQMQLFADLTKQSICKNDWIRTRKYLSAAGELFIKGTSEIKSAIATVYVFSVSSFLEIQKINIQSLFPDCLYKEYQKQVHSLGVWFQSLRDPIWNFINQKMKLQLNKESLIRIILLLLVWALAIALGFIVFNKIYFWFHL